MLEQNEAIDNPLEIQQKRKIIKNVEAFSNNYVPENLIHRDLLILYIKEKVQLGRGNIVLWGSTGTGKTVSVRKGVHDLKNCILIEINCVRDQTFASITKRIIEIIREGKYDELGKSRSQLSDDLIKVLKTKRQKKLIFLFDEIDKLIDKDGDHQQILNPILESTDSNIILISNRIEALNKLDIRLKSRLSLERKLVHPYTANEILDILVERAKEALTESSYSIEVIAKIAKICYDTTGDLRDGLNLLYQVAYLAESQNRPITLELLPTAKSNIEEIEFDKIYQELPKHQKAVICGIAFLSLKEEEGYAEHRNLYNFYENLVKKHNSESVGYRQFEKYLNVLSEYDLIRLAFKTPKNRRGRVGVSYPNFDARRFMEVYYNENAE